MSDSEKDRKNQPFINGKEALLLSAGVLALDILEGDGIDLFGTLKRNYRRVNNQINTGIVVDPMPNSIENTVSITNLYDRQINNFVVNIGSSIDRDYDGLYDWVEIGMSKLYEDDDYDNDGLQNWLDPDSDNDGYDDLRESGFHYNSDIEGIYYVYDGDNDGIPMIADPLFNNWPSNIPFQQPLSDPVHVYNFILN